MNTARRDLNNFQWRLVANAIAKCSLPIFVKLGKIVIFEKMSVQNTANYQAIFSVS